MGFVRGAKLTKKVAFMTTDKSDIEALACDIYNAHRTERIIAGAKNVASWWGMDARNREHWMKVARRLQPARVPEGWQLVPKKATGKMLAEARARGRGLEQCWEIMLAAAPQPEAAQTAGEAEEVGVFGERFIDGMGWAVPCSRAAPYVAAMRKAAFAMAEKEAGAYVGAGAHGIPDEPAPSAPADVEADIQKLESYLDDAGYPKDGDAQLTLESLAARLASAPQPTQRGGEGVEAVKQSLTGGGKNE